MKLGIKFIVAVIVLGIFSALIGQVQCYYNQAARKNSMYNGPTIGKDTETLKRQLRDLHDENVRHPAPFNTEVQKEPATQN